MRLKIGIPRSLLYHYYYPAWEVFFREMGLEIILSPETNKKIVDEGVTRAVDDLCFPFKVYYGHVLELIDQVNYIFVPRLVNLGKDNAVCPKFMGLPDMVKATFQSLPPLISPVINLKKGIFPLWKIAHQIGRKLQVNFWRVEKAYHQARKTQRKFEKIQKKGFTPAEALKLLKQDKFITENNQPAENLKIAVLGHSYIINDQYLSMDIINLLRQKGVQVITLEMIENSLLEKAALRQSKKLFWIYNREVMGAAYHLFFESPGQVQGIIQVTAFGCGPDSLVKELIDIKGKRNKVSVLNLNIDEHTGQAGLITRLEAFIDLLERRQAR